MIHWLESQAAKAGPVPLFFLLGAGASFGAGNVVPSPPPLAQGLYEKLAEAFPTTWGRFADRSEDFKNDFETTMEDCIGTPAISAIAELLEMARYFAQFEPGGGNDLYSRLLTALQDRSLVSRTAIGSLNYECVLERAAIRSGLGLYYEGVDAKSIDSTDLRVLKPHGSCNFLTRDTGKPLAAYLLTNSMVEAGITAEDPESITATLEAIAAQPLSTITRSVVMSTYVPRKITLLSPAQIERVRSEFGSRVETATTIIVIGARPNDNDQYVWAPLRARAAGVFYVGGDFATLRCRGAQSLGVKFADAWDTLLGVLDDVAAGEP